MLDGPSSPYRRLFLSASPFPWRVASQGVLVVRLVGCLS